MVRKIKQNKNILLLISFGLIVSMSVIFAKYKKSFDKNNMNAEKINISSERVITILKENVTDRCVTSNGNTVLVGENIKQLENGFYDIKVQLKNDEIKININKLWKNFDLKLYEEEYVEETEKSIKKIVNEDYVNLKDNIIKKYSQAKGLENIEPKILYVQDERVLDMDINNKELVITIKC